MNRVQDVSGQYAPYVLDQAAGIWRTALAGAGEVLAIAALKSS